MPTTGLAAFTLIRFGFGKGLGLFPFLVLLVVVGAIVWMLTQSKSNEESKD